MKKKGKGEEILAAVIGRDEQSGVVRANGLTRAKQCFPFSALYIVFDIIHRLSRKERVERKGVHLHLLSGGKGARISVPAGSKGKDGILRPSRRMNGVDLGERDGFRKVGELTEIAAVGLHSIDDLKVGRVGHQLSDGVSVVSAEIGGTSYGFGTEKGAIDLIL